MAVRVGRVHNGQKHHVPFVALELRGVSAENLAAFVFGRFESLTKNPVHLHCLLGTYQRHHTK